ncbi:MAG: heme A synthase [Burkholderiaceae bacterium]|nr:MAG: heme A synthase [Burkholderiaceae bacterium]
MAVSFLTTRQLALLTTVITFGLVVLGAYVRLSDAGLGCPDWPGCYGALSPEHAKSDITAAQSLAPDGPVSLPKAWKEMVHRYTASLVGALIVALLFRVLLNRRRLRDLGAPECRIGLPLLLLGVVVLQGLFGKWTVTLKLYPAVVTGHLLGGLLLLFLLTLYTMSQFRVRATTPTLRPAALFALLLVVTQITLGGWVSTNHAAPACGELPLCQQQLLPPMEFAEAFQINRALGQNASGQPLSLQALTAIHWAHRMFALVVFVFLCATVLKLLRSPGLRLIGLGIGLVLLIQITLGLTVVYAMSSSHLHLDWQLPIAAAHNAGAALLLALLTMLNYRAFAKA